MDMIIEGYCPMCSNPVPITKDNWTESSQERHITYQVLDTHVIVVACQGQAMTDWAAYIGSVPGEKHNEEWPMVLHRGNKLPQDLAEVLFPNFAKLYEWRD